MDAKLKSIGWTIINPASGEAQRTSRSKGTIFARKEPVKVYRTRARAQSFVKDDNKVAEVFVKIGTPEEIAKLDTLIKFNQPSAFDPMKGAY